MNDIERAELIQSLKAYLIPTSLFIACLIGAAGTFLVREGYQVGWAFIGVTAVTIVAAMWAFIRFQNKHRYEGRFIDDDKPAMVNRVQSNTASSVETTTDATNFAPDPATSENMNHTETLTAVEKA